MTSDADKAFAHLVTELSLDTMKSSLGAFYTDAVRSYDAIQDFMLIAPSMYPPTASSPSWHRKSAFLTYHWDTFDLAHSSYNESMLGNYSAAFILLRATLELLIRGAFFECLAHKEFRDQAAILEKDKRSRRLKHLLDDMINRLPAIERDFEETSVAIYDKISHTIDDPSYRPSNIIILRQLTKWGILQGIDAPVTTISHIYRKLSKDVHAHPNRTGIGRILIYHSSELFKPKNVLRKVLSEYLKDVTKVTDIGIVMTMNLLKENLEQFPQTRNQIRSTFEQRFKDEGLKHASARLTTLTTE